MSNHNASLLPSKLNFSFNNEFLTGMVTEYAESIVYNSQRSRTSEGSSELHEYTKLYHLIANNTSDIIAIYNIDFSFEFISPSVTKVLGYEPFEIIGKKPSQIFNVPDHIQFDQPQIIAYPHKFERHKVLLETVFKPIYINGEINSYLATSRDVTIRVGISKQLEASLEREKELNQLKSKLLSITSHELKNPLSTISSSVELLSIYFKEDQHNQIENLEKHIKRINNQVERLNGIINEVLTVEKFKQTDPQTELSSFELVSYVKEFLEDSFGPYYPKNIHLIAYDDQISVRSIQTLLYHILKNLIENAIKYSRIDHLKVEVAIISKTDSIDISVKDYGIGINSKDKDQLFNLFYRSNNVTNIDGSGIGLTIVKDCAEKLNARIHFTSTVGKGSIFTISLPKL